MHIHPRSSIPVDDGGDASSGFGRAIAPAVVSRSLIPFFDVQDSGAARHWAHLYHDPQSYSSPAAVHGLSHCFLDLYNSSAVRAAPDDQLTSSRPPNHHCDQTMRLSLGSKGLRWWTKRRSSGSASAGCRARWMSVGDGRMSWKVSSLCLVHIRDWDEQSSVQDSLIGIGRDGVAGFVASIDPRRRHRPSFLWQRMFLDCGHSTMTVDSGRARALVERDHYGATRRWTHQG